MLYILLSLFVMGEKGPGHQSNQPGSAKQINAPITIQRRSKSLAGRDPLEDPPSKIKTNLEETGTLQNHQGDLPSGISVGATPSMGDP
jgi:hypothetical protein